MPIQENLLKITSQIPQGVTLVAVSKTKTEKEILEAYNAGQKIFGENRVQELLGKYEKLPKDIQWHLIGHLQTNKVKYIVPFVSLIQSVDSEKLLAEINKEGQKINRVMDCLLEIKIAREESKHGMNYETAERLLNSGILDAMKNVKIKGLMGIATNTEDSDIVRDEFRKLNFFFNSMKARFPALQVLSFGMSSDFGIAIEEGSNMVRIGSLIFGER